MDHAGWLERNIAAHKQKKATAKERRLAVEHRGWHAAPDLLNDFQRRAVHILGIVGNGIYNAPITWSTVYWAPDCLVVSWRAMLSTFDFSALTHFVLLCHEARIRGGIGPNGFCLEIMLSRRVPGDLVQSSHPNVDEMIAAWRAEFPADHPIAYRGDAA